MARETEGNTVFERLRLWRSAHDRGTPAARDIRFNTEGWKSVKGRRYTHEWRDPLGNVLRLEVREGPANCFAEPFEIESLRTLCRREVEAKGGAIVSVEVVDAAGVPSLETIDKYERRPAYDYEGTMTVPLAGYHCTVVVRATEHGVTGVRDAVMTSHLINGGYIALGDIEQAGQSDSHELPGWFQDPYDQGYSGRVLRSAGDDERVDVLFPDHPLSRVRLCLEQVRQSFAMEEGVQRDTELEARLRGAYAEIASIPLVSAQAVASLLLQAGRSSDAEEMLIASLTAIQDDDDADRFDTAKGLLLLGFACEQLEKFEEARSAFAKAKDDFEAILGEEHPTTAQAMVNVARMLIHQGNHEEAEPLFRRGLAISETSDDASSNAGVALNGLGLVRNARGQYSEAIPYFERALEIFKQVHGPQCPDLATVLRNMASSWKKLGDHARMQDAWERAQRVDPMAST